MTLKANDAGWGPNPSEQGHWNSDENMFCWVSTYYLYIYYHSTSAAQFPGQFTLIYTLNA